MLLEVVLQSNVNRKKRRIAARLCMVLAFLFLFLRIHYFISGSNIEAFLCLMLTIFSCFLLLGGSRVLQKLIMKRAILKADSVLFSGKRKYVFNTNGIEITFFEGNGIYYWAALNAGGIKTLYLYITYRRSSDSR